MATPGTRPKTKSTGGSVTTVKGGRPKSTISKPVPGQKAAYAQQAKAMKAKEKAMAEYQNTGRTRATPKPRIGGNTRNLKT